MSRCALTSAVIAAALALGAPRATGQSTAKNAAPFTTPRLSDGTPDFRGIWHVRGAAHINIEGHAADRNTTAERSFIFDPPDGKIPYLPDALKQRDENYKNRATADPAANCYQAGVPRAVYLPTPFQIVQSPGNLAIVYTDNHAYRIVYPSTIPHDEGIEFFMGDSRGHWEGDTLVVDVISLGDQTWLDEAGNFHSDQLHVVERYTLIDSNTMKYEATLDDAKVYSRPWSIRLLLDRDKHPAARIVEDECLEGPDGLWHHLSPYDSRALLRHNYEAELAADAGKNQASEDKP